MHTWSIDYQIISDTDMIRPIGHFIYSILTKLKIKIEEVQSLLLIIIKLIKAISF